MSFCFSGLRKSGLTSVPAGVQLTLQVHMQQLIETYKICHFVRSQKIFESHYYNLLFLKRAD